MDTRTGTIYCITNTVNGKRYIGKTVRPQKRWAEHKRAAKKGSKSALSCAIRKYGPDAFNVEVVAESYAPFLDEVEKLAIWTYETHASRGGYNLTSGGEGAGSGEDHPFFGKKFSPEHSAKIGAANKGRKHTPDSRVKMSVSWKGRKGRKHTPETRAKISAGNTGKVFTPKQRANMSAGQTGRKLTLEHRAILSAIRIGKKLNNASSSFVGVSFEKTRGRWLTRIRLNGKRVHLGYFLIEREAALAYDQYVIQHGLNRPLNFPQQLAVA